MDRASGGPFYAVLAGIVAATLGIGTGELVAALLAPESGPVSAVGSALIDAAPPAAKDLAIAWFGTADKLALIIAVVMVILGVAAAAGLLEARRPPWGEVITLGVGAAGVVLAVARPDAGPLAWVPAALAGMIAALTLRRLASRALPAAEDEGPTHPDRRVFLLWSAALGAAGVLGAVGGSLIRSARSASTVIRRAVTLPAPAVPAPAVAATADLDIPGLAPLITPTEDFYRIDTALVVPDLSADAWTLRIHGMVDREVVISFDELLALPLEESYTTLMCVSNTVGGDLIGTAQWLGYPLRHLLTQAGPAADADMVLSRSSDGFTASTPLEALTDDRNAILAVGMNGEPLTAAHGSPVRMVVPGLYGYVSATKWVVDLEVTRFDRAQGYWTPRGWSARGPVKTESRIDVPTPGSTTNAGSVVIAGVAWHQHIGIAGVEVQVDDGPWREASLASALNADTWVQWSLPWTADIGTHTIRCRATNTDGQTQTPEISPPAPDGATGWHTIQVTVR